MRHLHCPKIEVWSLVSSDSNTIAAECHLKFCLWNHVQLISGESCDNRVIKNHQVSSPWQSKMYSALFRRWDLVLVLLVIVSNKEWCSYFNLCKDIIEIESRINVWGAWALLHSYLSGLHDIMKEDTEACDQWMCNRPRVVSFYFEFPTLRSIMRYLSNRKYQVVLFKNVSLSSPYLILWGSDTKVNK